MSPDTLLIDQTALDRLEMEVGAETLKLLLASMCNEISSTCTQLNEAVAAGDWAVIDIQAHGMKSASRTFGAERLGAACEALEMRAKAGAGQPTQGDIAEVLAEAATTLGAIDQLA